MGFFDALLGRSKQTRPNLDSLFAVPSAAITLQTAAGIMPTGTGSVCYRSAAGAAFTQMQADILELLRNDVAAPEVEVSTDRFGFTWLTSTRSPDDMTGLCTDVHAVNTALQSSGFANGLLCSLIPFRKPDGATVGLVYLYKQATYYPFCPAPGEQRDNLTEINVADQLAADLPMEEDKGRWMALWGAPGLQSG